MPKKISNIDDKIKPYLSEPELVAKFVLKDMPQAHKESFYKTLKNKYPHVSEKKVKKMV